MKKRKEERRHPSIEAAEASKMAAAEAESYQITVKANRSFANRNGEVTRSKLAIENRDPKLAQMSHVKINRLPSSIAHQEKRTETGRGAGRGTRRGTGRGSGTGSGIGSGTGTRTGRGTGKKKETGTGQVGKP
ncbi:uncharacterized protein LOC116920870 [Daphnia magna]|uniref:uncharacterized protein LOC116920870 n=1 Tax=Daphnia magna TaxID=35525 RepID=UPI001E1BD863|nr:uncharacterized protein LOC116920870 [Daphnia magna]